MIPYSVYIFFSLHLLTYNLNILEGSFSNFNIVQHAMMVTSDRSLLAPRIAMGGAAWQPKQSTLHMPGWARQDLH